MQPFTDRWSTSHPPVYVLLIAANVACFVAQKLIEYSQPDLVQQYFGLTELSYKHGFFWQFFTYTFLHGNPLHLLANMLVLYFAGREIESILGVRHFLGIYFGGGLLGGLAQLAFAGLERPVIGASAAVLAALIAFTTILPELEITALLFFVIPLKIRAKNLALLVVASSLVFALVPLVAHLAPFGWVHRFDALVQKFSMAHFAHLGGCLFGWLYVKQLGYGTPLRFQRYLFEKRRQADRHRHMSPEQFITQEIDPILEKISRDGIRSLNRQERRILNMGRDKIDRKPR